LIYRPFEPLTFYASYATSFLPQTASVLNVASPPPSTGEQVEAGTRVDLTPGLTLSAAAFQIVRDNVAATDPRNPTFSVTPGHTPSRGVRAALAGGTSPASRAHGCARTTSGSDAPVRPRPHQHPPPPPPTPHHPPLATP
ncbi:TonB-dependent receptor domain-containing protein, partial [Methylobacterium radiotolerans]|uniref:TonB-dependent receptor domain-containing protein n=1 Tax=Methylobacterium radiotolerans TaxID=31998 RepID=UPI00117F2678